MTDLIRSGMDNIKFLRVSGLVLDKAAWSPFSSEAKFCGVCFPNLNSSSRIDQRISIGFRSGVSWQVKHLSASDRYVMASKPGSGPLSRMTCVIVLLDD